MIKRVFYFEDKTVSIHSENTTDVLEAFRPGYYSAKMNKQGELNMKTLEFKEVHEPFPNQNVSEVIDTVNKFISAENRKRCNQMGYVYKLNMLLHGDPGTGKTALITYLCNGLVENHDAVVFRVEGMSQLDTAWTIGEEIRKIQNNLLVFFMDEFDSYCRDTTESFLKLLLDGERSIENTIVFAATNYLDKIPKSIRTRPSRFRVVSEIKPIESREVIRDLINVQHSKVDDAFFTEEQINELVNDLEFTTVDQVKTILIDKLMNIQLGLPADKKSIGFGDKKDENIDEDSGFHDVLETFKVTRGKISSL